MKDKEIKEKSFSVRCTKEEKKKLSRQAQNLNMSLSNYIIRTCLDQKVNQSYIESTQLFDSLCSLQTLINKFKIMLISRKDFVKEAEKEMGKLWLK